MTESCTLLQWPRTWVCAPSRGAGSPKVGCAWAILLTANRTSLCNCCLFLGGTNFEQGPKIAGNTWSPFAWKPVPCPHWPHVHWHGEFHFMALARLMWLWVMSPTFLRLTCTILMFLIKISLTISPYLAGPVVGLVSPHAHAHVWGAHAGRLAVRLGALQPPRASSA